MQNLGYQFSTSILLPGAISFAAAWLLIDAAWPTSDLYAWIEAAAQSDLTFGALILLGSSMFGAMLMAVTGMYERNFWDHAAANHLEISDELFEEEWKCYVEADGLGFTNSYLATVALYFHFQARTAVAFLTLFAGMLAQLGASPYCLIPLAAFFFLKYLTSESHYLLADWRHRMFEHRAQLNLARNAMYGDERRDDATPWWSLLVEFYFYKRFAHRGPPTPATDIKPSISD